MFQQSERFEDAVRVYDELLALSPQDPVVHTNRGAVLVHMQREEEAEQAWSRAAEFDPRYAPAYRMLGISQWIREETSQAVVNLTLAALLTAPEDPTQASLVGMWQEAMAQAKGVDLEVLGERLFWVFESGDEELAFAMLRELEPVAGPQAGFWVEYARAHALVLQEQDAIAALHRALELDGSSFHAHVELFDKLEGEDALEHGLRAVEHCEDGEAMSREALTALVREAIVEESSAPDALLVRLDALTSGAS